MAMKAIGDVSIKVGKYTDASGKERGRYVRVGVELSRDEGGSVLAIDAAHLSPSLLMQIGAGGGDLSRPIYLNVFSRDENGGRQQQRAALEKSAKPAAAAAPAAADKDFDDDIPF